MVGSGTGNVASPRDSFVGRERELGELVAACESAADGGTHLFLVHGEPGIGKTRIADELASRARTRGMQVLWGRCREGEGAPVYWPWIQIVRAFLSALDPERRRLVLESEVASDIIQQLAQIVPELRSGQTAPRTSSPEGIEQGEARFRLFDAVANILKIGARAKPLLIVLDDLHDADEASLAMLRFVAHELKGAPIVILATHRDAEVERSSSMSVIIGELARDSHPIPLRGLGESEVRRFVEVAAGQAPGDQLVAKLRDATSGNPLFLDGVVRILIADREIDSAAAAGSRFKVPVGVKEAIRRRIAAISSGTISILGIAAAIGKEFSLADCQSVAGVSGQVARHAMEDATRAGIVAVVDRGQYRFAHALIRDALYEELDSAKRIAIHRQIANRLEEIYGEKLDSRLVELAHHFREAQAGEKAIEMFIRAGHAASRVFAYVDATANFEAALELMELYGSPTASRADLLQTLGYAAFDVSRGKSIQYLESAIALNEKLGRGQIAATAHLFLAKIFSMRSEPQSNPALASAHLSSAESVLANGPETASLADLYSAVATNLCHLMDVTGVAQSAQRAMEISTRMGNRAFWAGAAASKAWSLLMSGKIKEGFELYRRSSEVAMQDNLSAFSVAWGASTFCLWLGDAHEARNWIDLEQRRIHAESAPIRHRWLTRFSANTFVLEGNLNEMRQRLASEVPQIRFWVEGQWEAAAKSAEEEAQACEAGSNWCAAFGWRSTAAGFWMILGEHSRAETLLQRDLDNRGRGPLIVLEMSSRPLLALTYAAANRLDDAAVQLARCREIMSHGEDWRALAADVMRAEGVLATARGNYEFACRQLASSLAIYRKYHLAWGEADALMSWGFALAAAGDRPRALEKFHAAIENYRGRGVGNRAIEWLIAAKTRALQVPPPDGVIRARDHLDSTTPQPAPAFRKEGEFWSISFERSTFRVKDAKGLHYIAYLLARPGQRIHVLDLVEAIEGSAAGARSSKQVESEGLNVTRDLGGPAAALDARARSEYRARLGDLQAELDEAERLNDLGHIERLRAELEAVERELIGSSGLAARPRVRSAHSERVRKIVGKNIRAALDRIRAGSPALGRHLATSISTGYFCAYQPDSPVSWQL